jgi:hypothetical protein
MYSVIADLPEKNFNTGKLGTKEALVIHKSEWDRIRAHTQLLQKDEEYREEQHMLQEKLKEKSKLMIKGWQNTLQVRNYMNWTCFHRRIKI